MPLVRSPHNPLITPLDAPTTRDDVDVLCTLNPGAVRVGEEYLLLVRVGEKPFDEPGYVGALVYDPEKGQTEIRRFREDDPDLKVVDSRLFYYRGKMMLTSLSHLHVAKSRDGIRWRFAPLPAILPDTPWEAYGCEDARITEINGHYLVTYTAVSPLGVNTMLAETDDFFVFRKQGIVFPTANKDVAIFPERIGGRYVCRHRPGETAFNDANIWTAWSDDARSWGGHTVTHQPQPGTWQSTRVGAGPPPIETREGWLELYHAADERGRYCLGVMLSDLEHPERVVGFSREPVLRPEADYERTGVYHDCVFCNGWVPEDDGRVTIFYGAADTFCASASASLDELLAAVK